MRDMAEKGLVLSGREVDMPEVPEEEAGIEEITSTDLTDPLGQEVPLSGEQPAGEVSLLRVGVPSDVVQKARQEAKGEYNQGERDAAESMTDIARRQ